MKNFLKFFAILTPFVLGGLFFVTKNVDASVVNSQTITLSSGWNIISTPKVLSSHQFFSTSGTITPETSTNFDIYLLDPTSPSGWQTMSGAGQTEFQPLFAYFINNKTGTNQTLQLNYNFNLSPAQQLFQRTLQPGWNTIGIASPSYALSQGSPSSTDTNNPSNILNSISNEIGQVIDFTNSNTNLDSPAISNTWLSKTMSDANSLNDFRELKGYGIFVTSATNNYIGSENLQVKSGTAPVITLNGASTVNLSMGNSYTDAGATASDNLDGNITANIVVVNPVNTNVSGTYTITYNVTDSSGNSAQQVTRTVNVGITPATLAVSADASLSNLQTASPNTAGVVIGSYAFQNQSTSESVRVTQLQVNLASSAGFTNLSNLRTSETSGSGANPIQPTANNTFSVNFTLAPGATKTIQILADTGAAITGSSTATVQTNLVATSIGVTSNVEISQNGNGTPVQGQTITLSASVLGGTPTLNSNSTAAQYVPAANGSTNATKATFNFTSSGGASTITELTFNLNTATAGTISSVTVNGLTAYNVGGIAYLTGLNIAVPNGGSGVNQDVYVTYSKVGQGGVTSGSTSQLTLTVIKYQSGGTTTVLNATSTPALTPVSSPIMTMVGTSPTVALNTASGNLVVGMIHMADVAVTANSAGDLNVNTIPLTFNGSQSATHFQVTGTSDLVLKDASGSTITGYTVGSITGSGTSSARAIITFTNGYQIPAGTTKTFQVFATIASIATGTGNSVATGVVPVGSFTWTDIAGGATTPIATSASTMPSYPTNTVSITN